MILESFDVTLCAIRFQIFAVTRYLGHYKIDWRQHEAE
jgi:hypothetical protein